MKSEALKSAVEYAAALKEIDGLMSSECGTAAGKRLQVLADLIEDYESTHFPIDRPKSCEGI